MTQQGLQPSDIETRAITAAETLPLRCAVLRPGRPVASAQFPGDDAATTRHLGAFRDGRLLGVASLFRVEMPEHRGVPAWQLRGMAVAPDARGTGLGRALAVACVAVAREDGARLFWCNARMSAVGFYRRLGWEIIGGEFQVPEIGPHFRMVLRL